MAERIRREEYAKMEHKLKATGGEAVTQRELEPENGEPSLHIFFLIRTL